MITAKHGDMDAKYDVGRNYKYAGGVEANNKKAIHWYKLAAQKAHSDANKHI